MVTPRRLLCIGLLVIIFFVASWMTTTQKIFQTQDAKVMSIRQISTENLTTIRPEAEEKRKKEDKLIHLYTKFYGASLLWFASYMHAKTVCEYKCVWSTNNTDYNRSDAVIFNLYNNLDRKDFVISKLPVRNSVDQKWILIVREPPAFYYPEQMKLLNNMFNLTMTFQTTADIYIPYGGYSRWIKHPQTKVRYVNIHERSKLVAWVVSNCITSSRREKYVEQLKEFIPVDVFGGCGKRIGQKFMGAKQYKFYLAFENSDCEDYITEKFWLSLKRGMIPIVRGRRANYTKFAPHNSYIHADSFLSLKHLAEYLTKVSTNLTLFNSYHQWKRTYKAMSKIFTINHGWMCDVCKQVHTAPRKTVDVYEQFSETTQCTAFVDENGFRNRTGEHVEDLDCQ